MNEISLTRQIRIGFGTIAMFANISKVNFLYCDTHPILDELETLVKKLEAEENHEIVVTVCLRKSLNEINIRIQNTSGVTSSDRAEIVRICQNILDTFTEIPQMKM